MDDQWQQFLRDYQEIDETSTRDEPTTATREGQAS
jgi:hypothetical protein